MFYTILNGIPMEILRKFMKECPHNDFKQISIQEYGEEK